MFNFLAGIIGIASFLFFVVNSLSGIVGGIWLAINGEWTLVFLGLAAGFFGPFVISLSLMPSALISLPAISVYERGNVLIKALLSPVLMITLSWTLIIMVVWAYVAFNVFSGWNAYQGSDLPHVMWAYSVATTPWTYLTRKDLEGGNDTSVFTLTFLEVACALLAVGLWLSYAPLLVAAMIVLGLGVIYTLGRGAYLIATS